MVDERMVSLRLAVRSATSGEYDWHYLGISPSGESSNESSAAAGGGAHTAATVIVSREAQLWALVPLQSALSEVGVGLKVPAPTVEN